MSWAVTARRVRDASRPLAQRVNALHSLLANHHAPMGFHGTAQHLRQIAGVARPRRRLPWSAPRFIWSEHQLLAALDELEKSRESRLQYQAAIAARRKHEKAIGKRRPSPEDVERLARRQWLFDQDRPDIPNTPEASPHGGGRPPQEGLDRH